MSPFKPSHPRGSHPFAVQKRDLDRRAPQRWCEESGKALGLSRAPGDLFYCLLCGRPVVAQLRGESVVVQRHTVLPQGPTPS